MRGEAWEGATQWERERKEETEAPTYQKKNPAPIEVHYVLRSREKLNVRYNLEQYIHLRKTHTATGLAAQIAL